MYWLHLTERQKKRSARTYSTANIQDPFADQRDSLYWTVLMITGNAELAMQSIIDATGLAETSSREFRDWLVLWAHVATARTALNAVRPAIQEAAKQYLDPACSHHAHEPLSLVETRALQELDIDKVVQQLDVLARAVLLLRGCHGASFEDCVFLLNVPLQSAVGAYCKALQWFKSFTEPAGTSRDTRRSQPLFSLLRPKWTLGV